MAAVRAPGTGNDARPAADRRWRRVLEVVGRDVARTPLRTTSGRLPEDLAGIVRHVGMRDARGADHLFRAGATAHRVELDPRHGAVYSARTLADRRGPRNPLAFQRAPHTHRDANDVTWAVRCRTVPRLQVVVLRGTRSGSFRRAQRLSLGAPALVHDLAVTEHWLCLVLAPVRSARPLTAVPTSLSPGLVFDEQEPLRLVAVPKDGGRPTVFEMPAGFDHHIANAYEHGGDIVVDVVRYPDLAVNRDLVSFRTASFASLQGELWRRVVTPRSRRAEAFPIADAAIEWPRVDDRVRARRHARIYAAAKRQRDAAGFHHAVASVDVVTGAVEWCDFGTSSAVAEPVFVPRPSWRADDGWLVTLVFDGARETTEVVVLDARTPGAGPVFTAPLPAAVPYVSHGAWTAAGDGRTHP